MGGSIALEYLKQKKLQASGKTLPEAGKGEWMVTIRDQYYAICCPCLLGKDLFEHVGKSGALGCLMRLCLPPCFLCYVGPKVAKIGEIPDGCGMAIAKTLCPCTGQCYAASVYTEYMYQKQQGPKASQGQVGTSAVAVAVGRPKSSLRWPACEQAARMLRAARAPFVPCTSCRSLIEQLGRRTCVLGNQV